MDPEGAPSSSKQYVLLHDSRIYNRCTDEGEDEAESEAKANEHTRIVFEMEEGSGSWAVLAVFDQPYEQ